MQGTILEVREKMAIPVDLIIRWPTAENLKSFYGPPSFTQDGACTILSTNMYDLVLLDVCHFGHPHTFLSNY